ncbi:hypothetical protein [Burkholderia sp. RF2-non_BP3]|uniref:hypothetical protein n=1 Tax=Burkholderia sp. RF2-non_BP3 TaxID=1637844 RepID=UPI0012E3F119|nr:hypothetical protein [Burkholderia sp. RF2-non_BP3]
MQAGIAVVAGNVSVLKRSGTVGSGRSSIAARLTTGREDRMIGFSREAAAGEWMAGSLLRKGRMRAGQLAARRRRRPWRESAVLSNRVRVGCDPGIRNAHQVADLKRRGNSPGAIRAAVGVTCPTRPPERIENSPGIPRAFDAAACIRPGQSASASPN